ncbi:Mss4-like protein, partial [Fistulina hepatica ATCC 64428]
PQLTPGLVNALKRPPHNRDAGLTFSSFHGTEEFIDSGMNKYDLICPREGCGSLILKKGVAKFTERASVQLEPEGSSSSLFSPLSSPLATTSWWLISPSMMLFENVGFSRTVPNQPTEGASMKLLACAECDLGPLGWSQVGTSEFWLSCSRVAYR